MGTDEKKTLILGIEEAAPIYKDIWNAAIEAAAEIANDNAEGCTQDIATIIRGLKK